MSKYIIFVFFLHTILQLCIIYSSHRLPLCSLKKENRFRYTEIIFQCIQTCFYLKFRSNHIHRQYSFLKYDHCSIKPLNFSIKRLISKQIIFSLILTKVFCITAAIKNQGNCLFDVFPDQDNCFFLILCN